MPMFPWWFKIGAKVILSRVPFGYRVFSYLGVFRHGRMYDADYAIDTFIRHFNRTSYANSAAPWVGLELGVGDSIASALIAHSFGASKSYLVDVGRFAVEDIDIYSTVAARLGETGKHIGNLRGVSSIEQLLEKFNSSYMTEGLESLRRIPSASVDFAWSNAVMEHIRVHEFDRVLEEFHRILKPDGAMSHRVDLKDHLGGALDNRRIPSSIWERDWMARSGFYTNRISYSDMLSRFASSGFSTDVVQVDRWAELPTPRKRMAREFESVDEDDLLVSGFDVLLRHVTRS